MSYLSIRKATYQIIERTDKADQFGKALDLFLILLIVINIVSVILETVESVQHEYAQLFSLIEIISVAIFSIEYLARIWTSVEQSDEKGVNKTRLQYALSPLAIIDLLAILPFYLSIFISIDLRFLRVLRLLRVFKLTRYSSAMTMLLNVFREEASAFFAAFFILLVLLILAASGAYLVEHDTQPDKFGSIPHAMWWAVATLTTVGYGDVTPITAYGKLFGAMVTVIGVGMAALPAGILASGLADQLRTNRDRLSNQLREALEDGVIDEDEESELEDFRKELGLSLRIALEVRDEVQRNRANSQRTTCVYCGKPVEG